MNRQVVIGIVGFALILILFVLIFTRQSVVAQMQLKGANEVGDAINGLTAPIIGIAGAILVFISFREQVKANRIQFQTLNEQRDLELMYRFYEELKEDLRRMQSEYGKKHSQPDILDSLVNYVNGDKVNQSPYPDFSLYIYFVFNQFIFISKRIRRKNSLSNEEIVYLIEKVKYLYDLYFKQYHKTVTSQLHHSEFSKEFKVAISEVHFSILELKNLHDERKNILRGKPGQQS